MGRVAQGLTHARQALSADLCPPSLRLSFYSPRNCLVVCLLFVPTCFFPVQRWDGNPGLRRHSVTHFLYVSVCFLSPSWCTKDSPVLLNLTHAPHRLTHFDLCQFSFSLISTFMQPMSALLCKEHLGAEWNSSHGIVQCQALLRKPCSPLELCFSFVPQAQGYLKRDLWPSLILQLNPNCTVYCLKW